MILRSDTVLDENNLPVPGASVYVYDINGSDAVMTSDGTTALLNPITTDEFGGYSYYADTGYYTEDIWFGGKRRWREHNIAIGNPGADLALRTDLSASGGSALVGLLASTSTGAVARPEQARWRETAIHPEDFGATGDGVADDTSAVSASIAAAAAEGRWLDGHGKTYAVTGTISAASNLWLRNITFKQLAPGASASVVTLKADTKDNIILDRVKVNRNGDGTNGGFAASSGVNGCLDTAFGIYILNCTNTHVRDIEVYGNDTGTGVRLEGLNQTCSVDGVYVHDITGIQASGDGTDENVSGIRLQNCTSVEFRGLKVINMKMTLGGVTDIWGTRGIDMGGLNKCRFIDPYMQNVGEAFDVSSSNAQADCVVIGGVVDTTYSYGFKLAHDVRRWRLIGCKTYNTGDHGFFGQSASNSAVTLQDANVLDGCDAINPGQPEAGYIANPSGFGFVAGGETNSIGVVCRGCRAIDNQATHSMVDGFYNEKLASATCLVKYENCEAVGYTSAAFVGEHEDRCHVKIAVDTAIADSTETLVLWGADVEDTSDLHSTSVNTGLITIKRPGAYHLIAKILWTGNATGVRQIFFQKNGTDLTGAKAEIPGMAVNHTLSMSWVTVRLNAGDTLGVSVRQTSGTSLNILSMNAETDFIVQRIAA